MNPKNNLLALIVLVLMVSCEKELPPYDERFGYVDGIFNDDVLKSENITDQYILESKYDSSPRCKNSGYVSFSYKMAEVKSLFFVSVGIANSKKAGGKCFDSFNFYNYRQTPPNFCELLPTLTGCYWNFDNCDSEYKPDPSHKSSIHIDKVTDKYITGKMDVHLISKNLPDNFPWTRFQPKTIHLKIDQFIAVKQ